LEHVDAEGKDAQEFEDAAFLQHVDLHVNAWTLHLGDVARQAMAALSTRAAAAGVGKGRDIEVLAVSRAT
jgi:predicted solute-binding protein